MSSFGRVLITGADGFVGRHLTAALRSSLPGAAFALTYHPRGQRRQRPWWAVDVTSAPQVARLVQRFKPDLILHLAAQASVGQAVNAPAATWATNVGGAIRLAEAVALYAPGACVMNISSSEVYGRSFLHGAVDENNALSPVSSYGHSKAAAEQAFGDILPSRTRLITLRPFNHTGPGQDERFVLPSFAAQIARIEKGLQEPVIQVGNLAAERDFLDVRDVIRAYQMVIEGADELSFRSVFNVASERASRVSDLLNGMLRLSPVSISVVVNRDRLRPLDIPRAVGVASSLRAATGWRAEVALPDMLAHLLRAAREKAGGAAPDFQPPA